MIKSTLLWILCFSIGLTTMAQVTEPGTNPATTGRNIDPKPIIGGIDTPFSMTFTIGNTGTRPISGTSTQTSMQFVISLRDCVLLPASTAAITGELLNFFDVSYDATNNRINGTQKTNVAIPKQTARNLVFSAKVTSNTATSANNTIGAECVIIPSEASVNANSNIPTDDVNNIYTHTEAPMPVPTRSSILLILSDFPEPEQRNSRVKRA